MKKKDKQAKQDSVTCVNISSRCHILKLSDTENGQQNVGRNNSQILKRILIKNINPKRKQRTKNLENN
jgi:hypothetical protein